MLYGTGDESQKAELEPWISKAAAESNSPFAAAYTGWIILIGDEREIYASMTGGRRVRGKAAAKDDKIEVEISGFNLGAMQRTITLKPGERAVVQLTDYPTPNNVFIALATKVDDRTVGKSGCATGRSSAGESLSPFRGSCARL